MDKILLVEDDKKLGQLVMEYLKNHGFAVDWESRGDKAIYRILHNTYHLIILDINLPGVDGLQVCRLVRKDYNGFILILTARETDEDQITGLEYGADDYVTKPIQPKVLVARINALLRRTQKAAVHQTQLVFGKLHIDLEKHEVLLKDKIIDLASKEFDLLVLLASNPGKTLTRNAIMQALRGVDYDGIDRSIDLRISHLRKKLGDDLISPFKIKTVRGTGYVFLANAWD